jgi:hypothetical protein
MLIIDKEACTYIGYGFVRVMGLYVYGMIYYMGYKGYIGLFVCMGMWEPPIDAGTCRVSVCVRLDKHSFDSPFTKDSLHGIA